MFGDGGRDGQKGVGAAGDPTFESAVRNGVERGEGIVKGRVLGPAVAEIGEPGNSGQGPHDTSGEVGGVGVGR